LPVRLADHLFDLGGDCVLVGGIRNARRSAWRRGETIDWELEEESGEAEEEVLEEGDARLATPLAAGGE
jgi:hypothetical protein